MPAAVELPRELAGHPRYQVVRLLGRGGMGAVYLAEHRRMGREVALKVINPELLSHAGALPRFQQEVRAAAKLDHPNIVAAHDADQAGGLHFLVMEYVEGENLADYLARRGPLALGEACDAARQAALGLQHAHERGMVHRDIKPHNLMRAASGRVKVLDFGLARFAVEPGGAPGGNEAPISHLTGAGAVVGTADYIAPEQAQNAHGADGRADVYSLGCTLYYLLVGRPPFPDGAAADKVRAHTTDEPRPLRELRPEVPEPLAGVVARMMAKRPEDRFQTPAEAAAALAPFAPHAAGVIHAPGKRRRPRRWRAALLAALALVLGSALTVAVVLSLPLGSENREIFPTDDPNRANLSAGSAEESEHASAAKARDPMGEVWRVPIEGGRRLSSRFSSDGRLFLCIAEDQNGPRILVGDAATGRLLRTLGPGERANGFLHERPCVLVFGRDGDLILWDPVVGNKVGRLSGHPGGVASADVAPGNGLAASGGARDGKIRLWDLTVDESRGEFDPPTKDTVPPLPVGTNRLTSVRAEIDGQPWNCQVAFSPDGSRLLSWSVADNTFRIWDAQSARLVREFAAEECLTGVAGFLPDGSFISYALHSQTVRVWNPEQGTVQRRFDLGEGVQGMNAVGVTFDGRLVTAHHDGTLRVRELATGAELARVRLTNAESSGELEGLSISPDGAKALVSTSGFTHLLSLPPPAHPASAATGEVRRFPGHTDLVTFACFTPDGRRLVTASEHNDRSIRIWDVESARELSCLRGQARDMILNWTWGRGWTAKVHRVAGHTRGITGLALQPDGQRLLSADYAGIVCLWDLENGNTLQQLDHKAWVYGLAMSPDGRFALTAGDGTPGLRIWALETGREVRSLSAPSGVRLAGDLAGSRAAWSPDGMRIAAGWNDGSISVWEVATWREERRLCPRLRDAGVLSIVFHPDGKRLLSCGAERQARLWNVETGEELQQYQGHAGMVDTVAVSRDGRRVLTGGRDRSVRLWDLETGRELKRFIGHSGFVFSVGFSPDGRYAVSAGADATVRLWQLPLVSPGS